MTVGEKMAALIKERGMTFAAVSTKANVRYSCLQPSLRGRRELRADEYLRLCGTLGIDPVEFIQGTNEEM